MATIKPKNWGDFQHYKDRSPAWIKLHKSLLDDFDFHCLPVASRALAPMLWLLASECKDGLIDCDWDMLAFRLRSTAKEIEKAIKPLIEKGFFVVVQDASNLLAEPERNASLEKRREEREKRREEAKIVLSYLNQKTGKKFENVDSNLDHMISLMANPKTQASVDDMKRVIDLKCQQWAMEEKTKVWLRPSTLFNPKKYHEYKAELTSAGGTPALKEYKP